MCKAAGSFAARRKRSPVAPAAGDGQPLERCRIAGGRRKGPAQARPRLRRALAPAAGMRPAGSGSSRSRGRPRPNATGAHRWPNSAASIRAACPNPDNPRTTPVPPAMDEQLLASIKAVGILQLPLVREKDGRSKSSSATAGRSAAIAAGLVDDRRAGVRRRRDRRRHALGRREPDPRLDDQRRHLARHRRPGGAGLDRAGDRRRARVAGPHHQAPQAAGASASGDAGRHGARATCRTRISCAPSPPQRATSRRRSGRSTSPRRATTSPGTRSRARSPSAASRSRPQNSTTSWRKPTAWSGRTICSRPPARTAATPSTSRASSAPSRSGCRTTCRSAARCCRATNTVARNCRRRPSTSTASPASTTWSVTTSIRTPAR